MAPEGPVSHLYMEVKGESISQTPECDIVTIRVTCVTLCDLSTKNVNPFIFLPEHNFFEVQLKD